MAADIVNVRPAEIVEVGPEIDVPGKVISCFAPSRTLQRIRNDDALAASKLIWNKLSLLQYSECPAAEHDLFNLISPHDCEDLIYVYLQTKGWLVYPTKRSHDTLAYEFVLRHRKDYRTAVVQVKTGHATIDLNRLPKSKSVQVVFAFQPNERFKGSNSKVTVVSRAEIMRFVKNNQRLLPLSVSVWLSFGH
jgi:hypothetical protein